MGIIGRFQSISDIRIQVQLGIFKRWYKNGEIDRLSYLRMRKLLKQGLRRNGWFSTLISLFV